MNWMHFSFPDFHYGCLCNERPLSFLKVLTNVITGGYDFVGFRPLYSDFSSDKVKSTSGRFDEPKDRQLLDWTLTTN